MASENTEIDRLTRYFGASGRSNISGKSTIKHRTYDKWKYLGAIPFSSLEKLAKKEGIEDPVSWATYIKTGAGAEKYEQEREEVAS